MTFSWAEDLGFRRKSGVMRATLSSTSNYSSGAALTTISAMKRNQQNPNAAKIGQRWAIYAEARKEWCEATIDRATPRTATLKFHKRYSPDLSEAVVPIGLLFASPRLYRYLDDGE